MGYDLHVTRRQAWHEEGGPAIELGQWRALVAADPELRMDPALGDDVATWNGTDGWLAWNRGNLETKNPDPPLIRKMVAIARALDAHVEGDDGEHYDAEGNTVTATASVPGVFARMKAWWRAGRTPIVRADPPPFAVGARVRDTFGQAGTVTAIDLRANAGLGNVTVRYDDGRVLHMAAVAHGLSACDSPGAAGKASPL